MGYTQGCAIAVCILFANGWLNGGSIGALGMCVVIDIINAVRRG